MSINKHSYNAFTSRAERIARSLRNEVTIKCGDSSVEVLALWDTGASNSCISHEVVSALGMVPTGMTQINTPSGSSRSYTYLIDVMLPNQVMIPELKVFDSAIGSQGIGMLVGMDIITRGDFSVSNYDGRTIFTFRIPSNGHADYVRDLRREQLIGTRHGRKRS